MASDGCNFLFHFGLFFALLPPPPPRPKQPEKSTFKKMKKRPGDIIILHIRTKN